MLRGTAQPIPQSLSDPSAEEVVAEKSVAVPGLDLEPDGITTTERAGTDEEARAAWAALRAGAAVG